jgi:hypothetical protein
MIRRPYKYVIYADDAVRDPICIGFADTVEEARKIKFDAELARLTRATIVGDNANEVE